MASRGSRLSNIATSLLLLFPSHGIQRAEAVKMSVTPWFEQWPSVCASSALRTPAPRRHNIAIESARNEYLPHPNHVPPPAAQPSSSPRSRQRALPILGEQSSQSNNAIDRQAREMANISRWMNTWIYGYMDMDSGTSHRRYGY